MVQPDNFSLYQPLVLGVAVDGRPRAARASPRSFVARRTARRPRDAVAERRPAGPRGARPRLRCGIAGGPGARHGARPPAIPWPVGRSAASALFVLVMAPWWLRQLAVFGSLSPSTASGKVLFIRDIGEWNSITTPATLGHLLGMGLGPLLATRIGGLVAAVMIYIDPRRGLRAGAVHGHRRLGAAAVARLRAVLPLRGPAVRLLGDRLGGPRARAARSSIRRSRSRRTPTSSRSRASPSPSPGSPRAGRAGMPRGGHASSPAPPSVFARRLAPSSGRAFVHGVWADSRAKFHGRRRPRSTPPARPLTDRVMSIDAAGDEVLDRPRRRRPRQRPDRDDRGRRTRLRHRVARPGSRRTASSRRAVLDGDRRPAWLGPPDPVARADRRRSRSIPRGGRRHEPARGVLTAARSSSSSRCSSASSFAAQIVFPKPEDTAYYVGVARNLLEGRGLVSRRAVELSRRRRSSFPRPAFEVWLPLPTFLAAIPMALLGHDLRGRPGLVVSSSGRSCRSSPGGWRATSPTERGLPLERARWRRARRRADVAPSTCRCVLNSALPDSTMPFAVIVLGCVPADDPDRRATRAALASTDPRLHRPRRPPRARRADPQRDRLAGAHLGRRRLAGRPARRAVERVRARRRRRGRRPRRLRPVGVPRLRRVRQPAAGPGASRTPST